ncbi:MAG: response regulator [Candidatus Omnitrophica bacterium]|nr:response regulator [Candidatus Omnitrophota bacterium]
MIKNILVADDSQSSALLLSRLLEKEGYKVTIAENGIKALDIIMTQKVDLLITDVVMPEMDGVDLYMELKNRPSTASLPVIIVTDKEVFKESFSSLGVEMYSPKPFDMDDLKAKIKKIDAYVTVKRVFHKVVIIGPDEGVLEKMRQELEKVNCIVVPVNKVIEIGMRCFLTNPQVILIDILTQDYASTKEIIRSLRVYEFFKHTTIVVYANYDADEVKSGPLLQSLEKVVEDCLKAGANKYIGRFDQTNFLELMKEFGIKD